MVCLSLLSVTAIWIYTHLRSEAGICILHLHTRLKKKQHTTVSTLTIKNTKAATDMTLKINKILSLH